MICTYTQYVCYDTDFFFVCARNKIFQLRALVKLNNESDYVYVFFSVQKYLIEEPLFQLTIALYFSMYRHINENAM